MESDLILYSVNAIRSMEVVDISTGSKLGYISDFKEDDIEIPWDKIVKIGVDVIIVDATGIEITQQDENKI